MSDTTDNLEQSFNEDELKDIMSEIESLEAQSTGTQTKSVEESAEPATTEVEAQTPDANLEEITSADPSEETVSEEPKAPSESASLSEQLGLDGGSDEFDLQKEIDIDITANKDIESLIAEEASAAEEKEPVEAKEESVASEVEKEAAPAAVESNIVEMKSVPKQSAGPSNPADSAMEFHVSGNMNLNMKFFVNGSEVSLHLGGDNGLVIELESGAKFTLPTEHKKAG